MHPQREDFQKALDEIFKCAEKYGLNAVEVISGSLHRYVGGYPSSSHRMPICCNVMKGNMHGEDKIIKEPPSGQGASVIIRYYLPR